MCHHPFVSFSVSLPSLRLWCQRVIGHKMFDHVILLFIFLNCITIALERPDIPSNSMVARTPTSTCCSILHPG